MTEEKFTVIPANTKSFWKSIGMLALIFIGALILQYWRIKMLMKKTPSNWKVNLGWGYFPINLFIKWIQGEAHPRALPTNLPPVGTVVNPPQV